MCYQEPFQSMSIPVKTGILTTIFPTIVIYQLLHGNSLVKLNTTMMYLCRKCSSRLKLNSLQTRATLRGSSSLSTILVIIMAFGFRVPNLVSIHINYIHIFSPYTQPSVLQKLKIIFQPPICCLCDILPKWSGSLKPLLVAHSIFAQL